MFFPTLFLDSFFYGCFFKKSDFPDFVGNILYKIDLGSSSFLNIFITYEEIKFSCNLYEFI